MTEVPEFWKSGIEDIEEVISTLKKGKCSVLGQSAGGRNIYLIEYGTPDVYERDANFVSACGAGMPEAYRQNKKPHIVITGGVHGAEWEGIVSLLNMISVFETGRDFKGDSYPELENWYRDAYIAIIPCMNPDGRARVPLKTVVGMELKEFRKWDQGVWNNGVTCDWPECKKFHPIKDHVQFMGGYFNDDGVNLMHDSFFNPMANETKLLMSFLEKTAPDVFVDMHGHGKTGDGFVLPAVHQPKPYFDRLRSLEDHLVEKMAQKGYNFVRNIDEAYDPDKIFMNMNDAVFLHCGAYSFALESDQGVICSPEDRDRMENRHERIYEKQMIFYTGVKKFAAELYRK